MTAKDAILNVFHWNDMILNSYLGDLTDAELLERPVEGQNHIAWQLGHLIDSERVMLDGVKPGVSPALPAGFSETHGRTPECTTSDDASKFPSKAEYLRLFKAQRDASKAVLTELGDADLDKPGPERFTKIAPTVGALYMLMGNHVLMHVGQFVSVRRKLKKPVAI